MEVSAHTKMKFMNTLNLYHANNSLCKKKHWLLLTSKNAISHKHKLIPFQKPFSWESQSVLYCIYTNEDKVSSKRFCEAYLLAGSLVWAQCFPNDLFCYKTICYVRPLSANHMSQTLIYANVSVTRKFIVTDTFAFYQCKLDSETIALVSNFKQFSVRYVLYDALFIQLIFYHLIIYNYYNEVSFCVSAFISYNVFNFQRNSSVNRFSTPSIAKLF